MGWHSDRFTTLEALTVLYAMSAAFGLGYSRAMTSLAICIRELAPVHRRDMCWGISCSGAAPGIDSICGIRNR